jgi:hypothetical protein
MNTPEAFCVMINTKKINDILELPYLTYHSYKHRSNQGKEISYKTMESLLIKAGWKNKGWIGPDMPSAILQKKNLKKRGTLRDLLD